MTAAPIGERVGRRVRRGAYLLPSLFTIGNMLLGFYAVICGYREGDFPKAAYLVFVAAFLDFMDGKIARMVGTESEFGKEYDSLADVITFGAVPALLTYLWGVKDLHRDAWLIPLFYMVCCATRLARFNVQTRVVDSRYFVGLPTPAAAGAVCSLLFFTPNGEWRVPMQVLVATALLLIGVLMVSTFRYASLKKVDLRKRWSFRALVPIVAVILVFFFLREAAFLALAVLYTLSGPVAHTYHRLRHGRSDDRAPPAREPAP
jgi:CDP-diacylglycerol---serine O-phosphatidyltransferase